MKPLSSLLKGDKTTSDWACLCTRAQYNTSMPTHYEVELYGFPVNIICLAGSFQGYVPALPHLQVKSASFDLTRSAIQDHLRALMQNEFAKPFPTLEL